MNNIIYIDQYKHQNINSSVAIGMFDGIHTGHKIILQNIKKISNQYNIPSVLLTFEPHPDIFLHKVESNHLLMSEKDKYKSIIKLGINFICIIPFTLKLSQLEPDIFFNQYIINKLHCKYLITGSQFKFGHKAKGNAQLLKQYCNKNNIIYNTLDNYPISSQTIRNLLKNGNITEANKHLSSPFSVTETIIHGKHIGQTLGFPTANLKIDSTLLIPKHGIYAGIAKLNNNDTIYKAAIYINTDSHIVEAHLLNFDNINIYGTKLTVTFIKFMRDIIEFNNKIKLIDQINQDVNEISRIQL